ncbi:usherin [Arapaima gigas]
MTIITYLGLLDREATSLSRMIWLLLLSGALLLLCSMGCCTSTSSVSHQGNFPKLENIGAYKTVTTVPSQSTCGIPERSAFCQPTSVQEGLLTCSQQFCVQECPYRSSTPSYVNLFTAGLGSCVTEELNSLQLGPPLGSVSLIFWNRRDCFTSPPAQNLGPMGSFTLAVWLKPDQEAVMTIIEKITEGRMVFQLTVSQAAVQIQYHNYKGLLLTLTMRTQGRIAVGEWTHVALQVYGTSISLFLNGLEEDSTAFDTQSLEGPIKDLTVDAAMRIGQTFSGLNQFIGRMQDFRFYPVTLTNRSIVEVYSGHLPHLHTQTECRCPPSHPRVHSLVERYCIPNQAEDITSNRVLRIHSDAHPLHYINDNDISTYWVSSVFSSLDQLDQGITISFDLVNGEYQVFYVILQFLSPQPEAVRIQRRASRSSDWQDWQYLAKNCSIFGMENNGPLEHADSVNCLQFPSDIAFTHGNVTFSVLSPEPNLRPGYSDFYNTPSLQEFVKAAQVRIHLMGQYHTPESHVHFRHRYYSVGEITISGRCNCHGHADHCDTGQQPYRCSCLAESHTQGDNCDHCEPLFNDKPFRAGDQLQAYNCRPCQCHGHASSCHYEQALDPYPGEHFRGGGGVCDSCQHNTTGRNCELCQKSFFQEVGADLWKEDVCKHCSCHEAGTINGSQDCNPIGGQCKCKRHVSGRQCEQCQHGFYKLHPSNLDGCRACNCNTTGTAQADITCHQDSGQCQCKANVIGLTCDRCNYGFKFLDTTNPEGCTACNCNVNGSLHQFCDPFMGQCRCKKNVQGFMCDTCVRNFYGLTSLGACWPCSCDPAGSVPGSACNATTGQCTCKSGVEGHRCNVCREGFYGLALGNPQGCLPCKCDSRGTVTGLGSCDETTGQCHCRAGVQGLHCSHCTPHFFNLSAGHWPAGCEICHCDPTGIVPGTACDVVSGQCVCLPSRHGRDCAVCKSGFFRPAPGAKGCEPCDCHPVGALSQACDPETGQCNCSHISVAGRRCDHCQELHFGFNYSLGRCEACSCNPAGSVSASCHPGSGQCQCKVHVNGDKCDTCIQGASHLDASNHLGCSKSPSQQPPPMGLVLNSSAIRLTWDPPDSANTNLLEYALMRDSFEVIHIQSLYPFGMLVFEDVDLSPYTLYTYHLVTTNVHGQTSSAAVYYRTLASIPSQEELQLHIIGRAGPTSITFNWTSLQQTHEPQVSYVLSSTNIEAQEEKIHYTGLGTEATANGLSPFTRYSFTLQACTSGGCARGAPLAVTTSQAAPRLQAAPRVHAGGATLLYVDWDPPAQPNGVIVRYELFMRGPVELGDAGNRSAPEQRVFHSTGWLSPQPTAGSTSGTMPASPQNTATVSGLEPFSSYQFRVLSVNMASSTLSDWTTGRTDEGEPQHMPPPQVSALSSSSLRVTWETPSNKDARGIVTMYRVNLHEEQTSNQYAPSIISTVLYRASPEERAYTAQGLQAYRLYNLTVDLCNRLGCVASPSVAAWTLSAAPAGLSSPKLKGLNMTVMEVSWEPPREPNGPPPLYQVERMDPSLSNPYSHTVRGIRFPGHSYFVFPSSTLPANTYFTGIQLSFRTREEAGLILCAIAPGDQEEYVALQLQNGRLFFLFDPQGSAVAVSPENDRGKRYNDNQWHHVMATRRQAVGTITVDNQYQGSSSATSGNTIIGQNTGVFIGGLPKNFTLLRNDTGDTKLVRQGFCGCLKDLLVKRSDSPSEMWESLDWDAAQESIEAYHSWEGCPGFTEEGAHFLGQGFLQLQPTVFSGGENFEISFEFKTDQLSALLLFAYDTEGGDYILAKLQGGTLSWVLRWAGDEVHVNLWVGLSYCDGTWNSISLLKQGALVTATMNELSEQQLGGVGGELMVNSPLYLGGVPDSLASTDFDHLVLLPGFGGCVRSVRLARGPTVSLATMSRHAVRVNLDGCLSAGTTAVHCRGNDSILVYTGMERRIEDDRVQPFTEYLYRVLASGEGGWTSGPWARGRSREGVPQSVLTPSRVTCVNGYSAEVSWEEPTEVRGVIEKYILKAYNRDDPSVAPINAIFLHMEQVTGSLSGLAPFTNYSITLTACTLTGCTESHGSRDIITPQEAPDEVTPPQAVSYPDMLSVYWHAPQRPNGIITQYLLYKNNDLIYTGNNMEFNITGLGVHSAHWLLLTACTSAGCSNSSQVVLFTAQMPPSHMQPPVLTVLDSRSIYVQWSAPLEVNGVLESYILYSATQGEEPIVVYNSSELFEDHTLRNLVPGSTYFIQIAACTGGGCTRSSPSVANTTESTPEDISIPTIIPLTPNSFNISWAPPLKPNGVITSYGLWMNGALVQNSTSQYFWVSDLSPWSLHSFRVQACTARGCALGPLAEARTLEATPIGNVALNIRSESPQMVKAKWQGPTRPNGNLTYSLQFHGIFYKLSGNCFCLLEEGTRVLHTGTEAGQWVAIGGLVPFSNYTVWVNACNSQGCVASPPTLITLPPGAPDGVMPPRLAAATPFSLRVVWSTPMRTNALGPPLYQLKMKMVDEPHIQLVLKNKSTTFSYTAEDLRPYTEYQFQLVVSHSHGETASKWASFFTAQDRPGPISSLRASNVQPRSATLTWQPPSEANGIITHYNIYQNSQLRARVPYNSTTYIISYLEPYLEYIFEVEGCTEAGCTLSSMSQTVRTPPAPPEDIPAPQLYSDTPTSVLLSWEQPRHPNGELQHYVIERRVCGSQKVSTVASLQPNQPLSYLDSSAALNPWTSYEYRVVVTTLMGGSNSSAWKQVTTRPSRPAGLQPPHVQVLGPSSIQVTWSAPQISNGKIERYEIRLPKLHVSLTNTSQLNYTITDLVPYTNYSVSILACSGGNGHVGGCTESLPTHVTTVATVPQGLAQLSIVAVSESFLAVSWPPPQRPNGPNVRYELLRRKTHQPLASQSPEDLDLWYNVYAGAKLFHEDKGLSRFTTYQYKLLVYNDVGFTASESVEATTLAGVPLTGSMISARALNHTAIEVTWSTPSLQDLQGAVELYTLWVNSSQLSKAMSFPPGVNSAVIVDLQPSTQYQLTVLVFNGAHTVNSDVTICNTSDGEPEGVLSPEVVTINSTAVRVLWTAPLVPNGMITEYSIYLDGQVHKTGTTTPGYLELGDLLPFTVYNIQVEVCTVYACARSNITKVTTVEDQPADLAAPYIYVFDSQSVRLDWMSPGKPNGILLGYDVRRRTLLPCNGGLSQISGAGTRCSYLECSIDESVCGLSCFQPEIEVCCAATIYKIELGHQCCGNYYLKPDNTSHSVCCGGQLMAPFPEYQCCGSYYRPVRPDEVCCSSTNWLLVSVGLGDSCCGGIPFSSSSGQICCREELHDGFNTQCCGGQVVELHMVCCGNEESGTAYTPTEGMACCGELYVNTSNTLCCGGHDGPARAYPIGIGMAMAKCCASKAIVQEKACCNGVGYDPLTHVCADRLSPGHHTEEGCGQGILCPNSAAHKAYCGTCDFNPAASTCTLVPPTAPLPTASEAEHPAGQNDFCLSEEVVIYTGDASTHTFTDTGLNPFTQYEYRVGVWNSFGWGYSPFSSVTTKQDVPLGVSPPRWSLVGQRNDVIQLDWKTPAKPNGEISHYVILRNGQERYRGTDLSFTDIGIQPFQEYEYQLRVCTVTGCTDSTKVVAATVRGVPESVPAPNIQPLGPRALQLSWSAPSKPNGVIHEYHLHQNGVGRIFTDSTGTMEHTVTGLQPHTSYSFLLFACTAVGCKESEPSTGRTLQDAPAGIWAQPHHLVLNSSAVELYWSEPQEPNGLVFQYRLLRDGVGVFSAGGGTLSYVDTGLQPGNRYAYQLEAATEGGSSLSGTYVIHTPVSSPERIPAPYNVTVTSPRSVFVAWTPPEMFDASLPLVYNILLNPGSDEALRRTARENQSLLLEDLAPFTQYQVRVQACQQGRCGVGEPMYIRTSEAPPEGLDPPLVTAAGPTVIKVCWRPPHKPNGIIQAYYIYRRPLGTEQELLVYIWSDGPLEFIDESNILLPFSEYEYCLKALNNQGSTYSPWALALTMEAEPEGMAAPTIMATGAYSVVLNWTRPQYPNGIITKYRVIYQKHVSDPTLNASSVIALTLPGIKHQTPVFGLEPYTTYSLRVEAVNAAGSTYSPWAAVRTLEAPPSGLANFTVEKRKDGRALLLYWSEPASPNGVIRVYNIYSEGNLEFSGLSRQFLFRRLEPYTVYSLVLEACTEAGCSRTAPQVVITEEAPPSSLPAPTAWNVGAYSVELRWSPPTQTNGRITQYQVIGLDEGVDGVKQESVLFTENNTQASSFSHNFTVLQPWTTYKFRIRAWNIAGYVDSPWTFVHTRQAPPKGLAPPMVTHVKGNPYVVLVSWNPPEEPNGVVVSYRIQRNSSSFHFSLDSSVLNYTDEDLAAYTYYSYAVIACTMEGCVTSPPQEIRTLEAPPVAVKPPTVTEVSSHYINVSWPAPLIKNGEITHYVLQVNGEEAYSGKRPNTSVLRLQPHKHYQLVLVACTNGGCTGSLPTSVHTAEAPPIGMHAPTLRVTGSESMEISWVEPEQPNGAITGYELRRDGILIYAGSDTNFHDFTLLPSVEYSYTVTANNSQGSTTSPVARARTSPSAPSGVLPPRLQPSSSTDILVTWDPPVRANGEIYNYTVFTWDVAEPTLESFTFQSEHSTFLSRSFFLSDLKPYYRYEVRLEACTLLGCASSEWATVQTLEAPPTGQSAPVLQLQMSTDGTQTTFLLSWSPPAHPNGKILHFELYRRQILDDNTTTGAALVYKNTSTSYQDSQLLPYSAYEYQVWAINSVGRSDSPWAWGRTGPAPPEGMGPPTFLLIHATSAVVEISPPTKPNGHISLYRVFAENKDTNLLLSEGTSRQQTLHGLRPFTLYSVRAEACTCFLCCTRGPPKELLTQPAPPGQQLPARTVGLTSRSALVEWDQPLLPNGIIESYELHIHTACPQMVQPLPAPCIPGPVQTSFFGKGWSFNITGLQPYTAYNLRVACYNNMGSAASEWTSFATLKEPPQYRAPFLVLSNLTTVNLDWSQSFALNGELREFVVMENGLRLYNGFYSSLSIPRTSDKTFMFQVTCITDVGSATTPLITYNTATGIGPVDPTPVEKTGMQESRPIFYTELWFIVLMVVLGLFLLALLLGLILQRALNKQPFMRERPPLLPLQKRSSMGVCPPTSFYMSPCSANCSNMSSGILHPGSSTPTLGLIDTKMTGSSSHAMSSLHVMNQSTLRHAHSQNSLHSSVSNLISKHDKKSLLDDGTWDPGAMQGHDSGMSVEDEDLVDTMKGCSTVRKEHTTFTDTHL